MKDDIFDTIFKEDIFDTIFYVIHKYDKAKEWRNFYDKSILGSFSYKFKHAFGRITGFDHQRNYIKTLYLFAKTNEAPAELLETLNNLGLEDSRDSEKITGIA